MVSEYLESLKERGKWNFSDLSQKTGLSESTIRRIFTDPDNNPTMDTLVKLVVAMGGSLDKLVGINSEMPHTRNDPETDGMQVTGQEMRELQKEMLAHQRESYERELSNLRMANERLVAEKKSLRRTLYVVLSVMISLMFTTILFLIYDLTHLDRGWIQFFYGTKSSQYDIGSVLQNIVEFFRKVIL